MTPHPNPAALAEAVRVNNAFYEYLDKIWPEWKRHIGSARHYDQFQAFKAGWEAQRALSPLTPEAVREMCAKVCSAESDALVNGPSFDLMTPAGKQGRIAQAVGASNCAAKIRALDLSPPSAVTVKHAVTCKLFPDPFDEREPVGPCTCSAPSVAAGDGLPGIDWQKLDATYEASTKGEWTTHFVDKPDGHALAWFGNHYIDTDAPKVDGSRYRDPRADADFCATMHNLYPSLRAAESLRARVAELEGDRLILTEIGLALESRGYVHMTNGPAIGALLDEKESAEQRAAEAERRAQVLAKLLKRYRTETPLGHQPHMIAHEVDKALAPRDHKT